MRKLMTLLAAILFTTGMAFAQTNVADIDQIGDDHEATTIQDGASNGAFVLQTADAGRYGTDIATATIDQTGENNSVHLNQRAFFGDAQADIVQLGDNNRVEGTAPGNDFYQNHGLNIIDVYMEGDNNVLYSLQGEAQKNTNTFLLEMVGNNNEAGLFQHFGYGDVSLIGDGNELTLDQRSGGFSGLQESWVDVTGDMNTVDIFQTGDSHDAYVNVSGNGNNSTINQYN